MKLLFVDIGRFIHFVRQPSVSSCPKNIIYTYDTVQGKSFNYSGMSHKIVTCVCVSIVFKINGKIEYIGLTIKWRVMI